jgi:hypothetical protein
MQAWSRDWLGRLLSPLKDAHEAQGAERGLMHALRSGLGCVERAAIATQLGQLPKGRSAALRKRGIQIGRLFVYCEPLLHPLCVRERLVLCWAQLALAGDPPPIPESGAPMAVDARLDRAIYCAVGYTPVLGQALRVDRCEAFVASLENAPDGSEEVRTKSQRRLSQLTGCDVDDAAFDEALNNWHWKWTPEGPRRQRRGRPSRKRARSRRR